MSWTPKYLQRTPRLLYPSCCCGTIGRHKFPNFPLRGLIWCLESSILIHLVRPPTAPIIVCDTFILTALLFLNDEVNLFLDLQTPTSKQSKYKEQVAEMRKGRNSGLQKEQKEKHTVNHWFSTTVNAVHCLYVGPHIISFLFPYLFYRHTGRPTATPESLCWRTSPVIMIWSSLGKLRLVLLKIW